MTTIITIIHLLIAIALVGVILLQRSEGGALGIGGGGGGGGGFLTGRGQANLLTRTTAFLAIGFIATSVILAILAARQSEPTSILDQPAQPPAPAEEQAPSAPTAPLAD